MRNFHCLATGVDVTSLMHAVTRNGQLWNANRFRTTYPNTPHGEVDDILLRFPDPDRCSTDTVVIGDRNACVWHPAVHRLPQVKPIVLNLMRAVDAYQLDRVLITRLRPGAGIQAHADVDGEYVQTSDLARYHIVLQGLPGSLYRCGDDPETRETVNMRTGEVWWFNAHQIHEVINNSSEDRVHLLVDVVTWP